ncbi:hypothetical protein H2200_002350 [Cladophialophora chaetospira]|uniref:U6 small nuclear RNA (adenine-(43)-N(6))-methyltransferase n=1 Tax=Cladophialophora chaetospira TaxID=386627 RepID=A0AA39CMZ8_9EURO|nr:hypothetical protein H2200_002350 [Cladophialophora chaetospira]
MPAPDNIYENDVDFTTLALRYPEFAKRLKPNRQLDFSDPESVRQLTKCLLHRDFDLTIDLPDDRLCPPVPSRFNYILFIQRLLDSTSPDFHEGFDPKRQVIGLDIGTGSSAIYPLLATRQRPQWRFLFTEIDEKNTEYAQKNISANKLQSRIRQLDTDASGEKLIPTDQLERFERVDILLTNPPFYSSPSELLGSAKQKARPPNSSCTGAEVEMITPGGEVAFVSKLITESSQAGNRRKIQWFSAMLGKLSSVGSIVEKLRKEQCTNCAVTEFVQGQKTRRWCVAWSWEALRPANEVARGVRGGSGVEKRWLPPLTEMEFEVESAGNEAVAEKVGQEIRKLEGVLWKYDEANGFGMLMSRNGDVWSRKARRRAKAEQEHPDTHPHAPRDTNIHASDREDTEMKDQESEDDDSEDEPEPALVTRITIRSPSVVGSTISRKATVYLRHLQGHDSVLFESFCGWLKRKVIPP